MLNKGTGPSMCVPFFVVCAFVLLHLSVCLSLSVVSVRCSLSYRNLAVNVFLTFSLTHSLSLSLSCSPSLSLSLSLSQSQTPTQEDMNKERTNKRKRKYSYRPEHQRGGHALRSSAKETVPLFDVRYTMETLYRKSCHFDKIRWSEMVQPYPARRCTYIYKDDPQLQAAGEIGVSELVLDRMPRKGMPPVVFGSLAVGKRKAVVVREAAESFLRDLFPYCRQKMM